MENNGRPTWDQYFIYLAKEVSNRGTCWRAKVGAVVVKDNRILATGYNGSPSGEKHCIETGVGCLIENGHCIRTIHAETNAVAQAARFGIPIEGATVYIWSSYTGKLNTIAGEEVYVCNKCNQVMKAAGIKRIVNKYGKEILL